MMIQIRFQHLNEHLPGGGGTGPILTTRSSRTIRTGRGKRKLITAVGYFLAGDARDIRRGVLIQGVRAQATHTRQEQLNDYGLEVHRFKVEWNSVVSAKAD